MVAVDNSKDSLFALSFTLDNLVHKGDSLSLVHVVPRGAPERILSLPGSSPAAGAIRCGQGSQDQQPGGGGRVFDERQAVLTHTFASVLDAAQVPWKLDCLALNHSPDKGSIGSLLCDHADKLGAAVVVMATRSRGGLGELLQGSVAAHLTHHCNSPVIVLHKPRGAAAAPGEEAAAAGAAAPAAPGQPKGERSLIVAVDESAESLAAAHWVADNVYRSGDTLHIMHVVPHILPGSSTGLAPDGMCYAPVLLPDEPDLEQEEQFWRELAVARFSPGLEARGVNFHLDVCTHFGQDPGEAVGRALCAEAECLDVAALVVCPHAKGPLLELFMGSVTQWCVHRCRRPVVVLRGKGLGNAGQ